MQVILYACAERQNLAPNQQLPHPNLCCAVMQTNISCSTPADAGGKRENLRDAASAKASKAYSNYGSLVNLLLLMMMQNVALLST